MGEPRQPHEHVSVTDLYGRLHELTNDEWAEYLTLRRRLEIDQALSTLLERRLSSGSTPHA